jgi:hypothetical protein
MSNTPQSSLNYSFFLFSIDVSKLSLFLKLPKLPGAEGEQVLNDPSSYADGIPFYFQFHFSFSTPFLILSLSRFSMLLCQSSGAKGGWRQANPGGSGSHRRLFWFPCLLTLFLPLFPSVSFYQLKLPLSQIPGSEGGWLPDDSGCAGGCRRLLLRRCGCIIWPRVTRRGWESGRGAAHNSHIPCTGKKTSFP